MTRKAVVTIDSASREILELVLLGDGEAAPEKLEAEDGQAKLVIELADDAALEKAHSGYFGIDPETGGFVELPFKVAVLDAGGVLMAVEEIASSAEITPAHLDLRPYGGDCDLPAGKYRWDEAAEHFIPLKRSEQLLEAPGGNRVSLEEAFAQLLELNPQLKQGDRTMVWLAGFRSSVDAHKRRKQ